MLCFENAQCLVLTGIPSANVLELTSAWNTIGRLAADVPRRLESHARSFRLVFASNTFVLMMSTSCHIGCFFGHQTRTHTHMQWTTCGSSMRPSCCVCTLSRCRRFCSAAWSSIGNSRSSNRNSCRANEVKRFVRMLMAFVLLAQILDA